MLAPDPGTLRADAATRLVGSVSLVATTVVYAMALEALRRTEGGNGDDDRRVWYLGYTRDFTNALGVVLFWLSYFLLGFPLHLAFAAGATTALVGYVLDYGFARALGLKRATIVLVAAILLLTLPAQVEPHQVADALGRLINRLFG